MAYFGMMQAFTPAMIYRLGALLGIGVFQGVVGWWMVKSGLTEPKTKLKHPRVSPYRLAFHLTTALVMYAGTLYTAFQLLLPSPSQIWTSLEACRGANRLLKLAIPIAALLGTTIISGAFVAGNDAGFTFNTWPKMNDEWIPSSLRKVKLP
eukprot:Filipodium_phascolosomae@DN2857_c0_g1_i1.p1